MSVVVGLLPGSSFSYSWKLREGGGDRAVIKHNVIEASRIIYENVVAFGKRKLVLCHVDKVIMANNNNTAVRVYLNWHRQPSRVDSVLSTIHQRRMWRFESS